MFTVKFLIFLYIKQEDTQWSEIYDTEVIQFQYRPGTCTIETAGSNLYMSIYGWLLVFLEMYD